MSNTLRRPRYADVMSTLAVVIALTGTATAAGLAANSVKSKQITNGAVRSVDVKDGDLLAADFKAGELVAGPPGTPGKAGATGPAGPTFGWTRPSFSSIGTPENVLPLTDTTFTLPAAGPVLVTALSPEAYVNCSSATNTVLAVMIDGVSVPGTVKDSTSGTHVPFVATGVTTSLAAGSHTIVVGGACVGAATSNGMGLLAPSFSVVLLGSS